MKCVVVGGTRGMGRALARLLAGRGDDVFLLGRHPEELERSAADLRIRGAAGVRVGLHLLDLEDPRSFGPGLDAADAFLGGFDLVVLTAALFGTQEELEGDGDLARRVLTADFANSVTLLEAVRKRFLAREGGGRICAFSSVAGDRARKPVVLYGAAKAGLSAYLEGLDHRYRRDGLITTTVKPGFVRTSMTAGLPAPPFAGDPELVARRVLKAIDRGRPVVYAPPVWWLVMAVIRRLPRFVMRRIRF